MVRRENAYGPSNCDGDVLTGRRRQILLISGSRNPDVLRSGRVDEGARRSPACINGDVWRAGHLSRVRRSRHLYLSRRGSDNLDLLHSSGGRCTRDGNDSGLNSRSLGCGRSSYRRYQTRDCPRSRKS